MKVSYFDKNDFNDFKGDFFVDLFFVSGLQMTDVELDARVTALEENDGGNTLNGNNLNALLAVFLFHSLVIVSLNLVAEILVHFVYFDKFSMQIYIPLIVKYE